MVSLPKDAITVSMRKNVLFNVGQVWRNFANNIDFNNNKNMLIYQFKKN